MAELQPSKLTMPVRSRSPAPLLALFVELLGRYSNLDITSRLRSILADGGHDRPPARPTRSLRRLRRLTETELEDLIQRYQQGTPINVLAADLGLHRTTISAQLKAMGVLEPARRISDLERDEVTRLYQQGLSLVAVAERLGVSSRTVHRVLQQSGVQTRPVGTNQSSARF